LLKGVEEAGRYAAQWGCQKHRSDHCRKQGGCQGPNGTRCKFDAERTADAAQRCV